MKVVRRWTGRASGASAFSSDKTFLNTQTPHLDSRSDLEGLSALLESSQKASDEAAGGVAAGSGARALGPGDIGPAKSEAVPGGKTKAVTKDIWGDDDIKEGDLFSTHVDPSDKRPEPVYKARPSAH